MRPSFIYHQIHSIISIISTIFVIILLFRSKWNLYEITSVFIALSIMWGIHATVHYWEEVHYNFNPMIGHSKILDMPNK